MRSVVLTIILCLCSFSVCAQYVIRGKIVGKDDGLPLPKAPVIITGTNDGVQTDMNGEFSLTIPNEKATITISYIGYKTKILSPDFENPMFIKLSPDCTHHHYHSTTIKFYGGLDLTNNALTGRVEFPRFRLYKTITSSYEVSGLGGQEIHRADAKIWDLTYNCKWDLNLATSYRNYDIKMNGFSFNSVILSPQIGFNKTEWILGLGHGVELLNDAQRNSIGVQLGLIREFPIQLREWVYIPVKITATKWNSFWDIETSVDFSYKAVGIRLSYNRINNFDQFSIMAGIGIRH